MSTISDKVKALATLATDEAARISDVLPPARLRLKQTIGDEKYTWYQGLPDGDPDREQLDYAVAYYALYHLVVALKRLHAQEPVAAVRQFGQANVTPAPVDDLFKLRNEYLKNADEIASRYRSESAWYAI